MVGVLERSLPDDERRRRSKAQAIAALCVGGMVVARAMANRAAADELRDACMSVALDLGGSQDRSASRSQAGPPDSTTKRALREVTRASAARE